MRPKFAPWLVGATLAAAVAGCSPQYQTFTNYAPPEDHRGRQCLAQCQQSRQLCRQGSSLEVQQCRLAAQSEAQTESLRRMAKYTVELQQFQAGFSKDPPASPTAARPNYRTCDHRASGLEMQCTAEYDLCYQNCGGVVTYTTQCVANCDHADGL